jgi:hypothetical protein
MEKLQNAQASRRAFSEQIALSAALGPIWNDVRTKWDEAIALLEWTRTALSLLGKERLVELAARSRDHELFSSFATRLETLIQEANRASTEVNTYVKPDPAAPFGAAKYHEVPIRVLRQLTAKWLANIDKVNDWVSARNALTLLREEGLTLIADRLEVGNLRPAEARSAVDLLFLRVNRVIFHVARLAAPRAAAPRTAFFARKDPRIRLLHYWTRSSLVSSNASTSSGIVTRRITCGQRSTGGAAISSFDSVTT